MQNDEDSPCTVDACTGPLIPTDPGGNQVCCLWAKNHEPRKSERRPGKKSDDICRGPTVKWIAVIFEE
jgi:hypothetical protein